LRPRNVLKNAAGNIFVVDDIVTENDVQTKESGKEREIRFQVIPPGNPTPQLETTPDNDATPPVYREGESILDYAKRVSDWWKTSKPEQSATEKALNDAVLSIAELKVQRNRLNSKISGLKKTSGNRAQRIAEIKEHVGEARKYIHENLSKDMVEWMGATEFNAFISDMDKATSTRDMERILMHIDRTINNVALRKYGTVLKKLLNLKVSDKNDRGVSVAKNVDEDTRLAVQYINENKGMSEDVISGRVNEIYNEYIAANQNTEGEAEMTPEQLRELTALEYLRKQALINALSDNISKIDAESKNISAKAHEDFIADSQARSERRKALEKERISAQRELIEATKDAAKAMGSIIESGKLALSGFTKEQKDRKLHVNRIANAAVANGKDWSQVEQKAEKKRKAKWLIDSSKNVKDFALGTLNNFNTMLKLVDTNNLMGKGRLYDYFMLDTTGAMAAGQNYRDGMRSAKEELQDAAKRITGKSFSNLFFESTGKAKGVSLEYMDKKGVKRNIKMSYGELLYLYSVGKMADGRIKLERMGIDEAALEKISEKIPQRLRDFMDWVQSDFLPKRREKYNETHKKMFGTSMAKIEGYFPLRYDIKEVKKKEKDIAEEDIERMPSSVTGAIINRVRNGSTLDLSANAFDVLVNNVNEMEEWNAYAQVRRDVNTVCSNQFFENSVEANMKGSYNLFKDAARVAVRSFKDKDLNWIDKVAGNINKSVAVGAIGFRLTTAMKQFLSYPAFMGYSINPAYQARLIQNALPVMWIQNWQWAMKELPGFKDRWDSRNMGDEKLMDEFAKTKFDKFTSEAVNVSLFPNRLIDAITVVAGAKSVYDYQFVKNKKAGMDEAEAKRRALISASVAYNETQQSALDEFLSPTQKSGTALARAVTTFQNAGFSFMRKEVEPVVENYRITVNNKELMEGTMKKYIKDGMSEEEARKQARKDLTKAFVNNLNRQGIFLFALGMIWRYGIPAITGTLGDDDDEKEKDMLVSMAISPVDGTVMIGQFLETESKGYDYSLFIAAKEMEKLRKDFVRAVDEEGLISWDALYATGNIGLRLKGLNLESLSNIYKGFEGMFKDKSVDANDVLTVLNYPKTDKRAYAAKIKEGEGLIEYAGRIRKAYDNDKLFDRYVGQYINKYYFHDADGDMTEFNRVLKKAKQWEKLKKAGDKSDEFTELNKDAEFWKQLLKDVTTLKKGYKEGYEFKAEELKDIKEGIKNREPSYME
jgi:hypothetical protein